MVRETAEMRTSVAHLYILLLCEHLLLLADLELPPRERAWEAGRWEGHGW